MMTVPERTISGYLSLMLCCTAVILTGCADPSAPKVSIWEAAEQGDLKAIEYYLSEGVDVNAKNERVWMEAMPLHYAAEEGAMDAVALLIENGADVNALGRRAPLGKSLTPLDVALLESDKDSAEKKASKEAVADYLREHGAKTTAEL